jgi:L-fuculose-phosphate aldolase
MASLREQIVATSRAMLDRGLVTGTAGNVSARLTAGMLITPTRVHPADLRPGDLVELGLDGAVAGPGSPSVEWRLHAAILRSRADVLAIVHTHSPHAVARSFDPAAVEVQTQEREYLGLDRIAVAPPVAAGTAELAEAAMTALAGAPAVLLARHGVVAVGRTPRDALELASTIEHLAQIDLLVAWSRATASDRVSA